ncbi:HAD-IIB family hydrolase [Paenibacillus glycinis]|uniref:HAD-IIB family hydrolase n=1 Tax=Paenibacillus glycinis TaxID=2697035 RepID=A0ABW9XSK3_9BACL|nr:HAD family hydrolase [Paenibacillus glycinis]NBD25651.1 HAD-IIB family hydrolase [Paenibacillus glycinis]
MTVHESTRRKLFLSDIDGTLMNSRKQVRAEDIEAVREAHRQGVVIALASGRMHAEIVQVIELLGVPCYAICQNGADLVGLDGNVLRSFRYEADLALSVQAFTDEEGLVPVICSAEGNFVADLNPRAVQVGKRFLTPLRERRQLAADIADGMPVTKFSVYGEVPALQAMLERLRERFGGRITASFSDPDGVDVMPGRVDKGAAAEALMALLGIGPADTACIGDSFNDLAMFRACAHSVAMSHSPQEVRRAAAHAADTVALALREWLAEE